MADAAPVLAAPRGSRTRTALLAGAREVFERDGYVDAKITAITAAAGVATGSFYTHFDGKADAFAAVIAEVHEETLHPHLEDAAGPGGHLGRIEATNRAYLAAYERNARLFALMEQVTLIDPDFRAARLERGRLFAERNARAIERMQAEGVADPALDPLATAHALNAMTSRMASTVFVHGLDMAPSRLLATLTQLWANALRLKED